MAQRVSSSAETIACDASWRQATPVFASVPLALLAARATFAGCLGWNDAGMGVQAIADRAWSAEITMIAGARFTEHGSDAAAVATDGERLAASSGLRRLRTTRWRREIEFDGPTGARGAA